MSRLEREADKNLEQRQAKWHNFYQTCGGMMFMMCDNCSCMRNIRSKINYCLVNKPLVVSPQFSVRHICALP